MKGTATVIQPDGYVDNVVLNAQPSLEQLQKWVRGHIELVPGFDWYRGSRCFVFCNGEGKLEGMSTNEAATSLWYHCLGQSGRRTDDVLVGPIAVIMGDDELLCAL